MAHPVTAPLVSAAWLAERLGQDDLVVFDATKFLPNEGRDGQAEFRLAHLPGARFFDIDEVADPETSLPHMAPSAGRFERLLGALGVSNQSTVVFYDQKGLSSAARGWWLMRLFGHDDAAVLDGGLPAWRRAGGPVEAGDSAPAPAAVFRAEFRAQCLRGLGDMRANLASGRELVLDARSGARFAGAAPEPRPGLPGGHIPGSRNLPSTDLLRPDGTMRDVADLRARFAAAGVDGQRPVVTTCGTGVTAAILTLGLLRAGFDPGAVYDGSWTEWAGHPATPKETN